MERKYKDTKTVTYKDGRVREASRIRKGLKVVHIGKDVWRVGRPKNILNPDKNVKYPRFIAHQVIYGPNNKEYHLYGKDLFQLSIEYDERYKDFREYSGPPAGYCNRDGNVTIEASVKIYILTSILDKRENWCFDLKSIPENGKLKVIYHNGTVKNIDFNGKFEAVQILGTIFGERDGRNSNCKSESSIIPVAYRKVNNLI